MKLIIEIPEKVYNAVTHTEFDASLVVNEMRKSIANGIPLPKGHGALKDTDKIISDGISKGFCDWYDEIKYADTIIEADKIESENK